MKFIVYSFVVMLLVSWTSAVHADPNKDLHRAVSSLRADKVRAALESGADPNQPDAGYLPLGRACKIDYKGQKKLSQVVQILLDAGADPNAYSPNGETALYLSRGSTGCIIPLLAAGADPNARPNYEKTTCSFAKPPIIERVLAFPSPENVVDGVRALLAGGANPGIRGCNGQTMHGVVADNFLRAAQRYERDEKSGETPPAGWWRPHVALWKMFDGALMADTRAQDTMVQALSIAITTEQEAGQ